MKLYFLRHAEAEDGPVDAVRALTGKGRKDARRLGRFLRKSGVAFDAAFSSPLVRAVQTADLVLAECPLPGRRRRLVQSDTLLNETPEAAFVRWLRKLDRDGCFLLVGHEPSLGARVRRLLGLEVPTALPLSKGALARVDSDDGRTGLLKLLVSPRQLP